MITFTQKGDFSVLNSFLEKSLEVMKFGALDKYGKKGVEALSQATPKDTGLASRSWSYNIVRNNDEVSIEWSNSDIENGCNVVILLQYGHGTKSGGYVAGKDFINPAIQPIFDEIAQKVWEEVCKK